VQSKFILSIRKSSLWLWRNLNAKTTEARLSIIVSLAMRLIGLLLLIFACMLIWRLTQTEDYTLEVFSVPKSLEESGHTGAFIAQHIQDELVTLKKNAGTSKADSLHIGNASETDFSVSVMGLDLSIKKIAHQIRLLFGRPVKTIEGELTQSDQLLLMTLRVSGYPPVQLSETIDAKNLGKATTNLCKQGAEALLSMTDPYRLAIASFREKRYDYAIEMVRKIIKERPHERVWAYIAWGSILEDKGNLDMAVSKFQRATQLDSSFALAWQRWGNCLVEQRKIGEAIEKYETALRYKPDNAQTWLHLAWLLLRNDEKEKSNAALEKVLYYADNTPTFWISCAEAKMAMDSSEAARKLTEKAIAIGGETSQGYLARALLAVIDRDTDAIIRNGLYTTELDPANFYGGKIAMIYAMRQKKYAKVIEIGHNIQIHQIEKNNAIIISNILASAYSYTGKMDSAFAIIKRAIAIDSTQAYPYSTLGEIYAKSGNMNQFYANLEQSFKMGMPVKAIDPLSEPYKNLQNEPRYKALIQKYSKSK
jgi:tetratricopeptide (TPR) repeat protein